MCKHKSLTIIYMEAHSLHHSPEQSVQSHHAQTKTMHSQGGWPANLFGFEYLFKVAVCQGDKQSQHVHLNSYQFVCEAPQMQSRWCLSEPPPATPTNTIPMLAKQYLSVNWLAGVVLGGLMKSTALAQEELWPSALIHVPSTAQKKYSLQKCKILKAHAPHNILPKSLKRWSEYLSP